MKEPRFLFTSWPILLLGLFASPQPALGQATLIPAGSVWKYLDTGTNLAADPWQAVDYDDSAWLSGPAELGYGDQSEGRREQTVIRFGQSSNKYITYYFRRAFAVADASVFGPLALRVMRDDGVVVYLNGTEVWRDNLPAGSIDARTFATNTVQGTNEFTFFDAPPISPALLVSGSNIVAVEIHQRNATDPDVSFDLELRGTNPPPSVVLTSPANGATFMAPAAFALTADAADTDGVSTGIAQVEFFQGGTSLAVDTSSPYGVSLSNVLEGDYTFVARATDSLGARADSTAVAVVVTDLNPPVLLSASGAGNEVIVTFSKRLVEPGATDTNNYAIDHGVMVLSAAFGATSNQVVLATTPIEPWITNTLTVSNVQDRDGQTIARDSQVRFAYVPFTSTDVGNPAIAGTMTPAGTGVDLTAAGADINGTSDQFQFSYRPQQGDFDVKVRLAGLELSDAWAKAGLMARETLAANSRYAATLATPCVGGCFFQYRATNNGATFKTGAFPATYPNTWLRLQRVGNVFHGYAGLDGINWSRLGSLTSSLPATLWVGMAATSRATNTPTVAQFRDVMDVSDAGPAVTISLPFEPLGPSSRKTALVISEIMYHPRAVATNHSLEYIEIFNSQAFYEDIGGYRISGDVDYTFAPNTIIPAGGFVVVARDPAFVQSHYGISGVLGPWDGVNPNDPGLSTNNLPGGNGTVRLRNEAGAVTLEVNYRGRAPWPLAADGAGHSLVLARPSYGEGHPMAWAASETIDGSPGRAEPFTLDPLRSVMINEFLANTAGDDDFIELYNHSRQDVDISGCYLTDESSTNKYQIPPNTMIPAGGYLAFSQNTLGFALNSGGERIYFVNPAQNRVIDVLGFDGQANGVSSGRYPNGAASIDELATPTPGAANSAPLQRPIVISEIMYNPITGDGDDEYVELYNQGTNAVNLGGWRFTDGIDFKFPANTILQPGGYTAVCRDVARLRFKYPHLNTGNSVGNFDGNLANGGERIALSMPDIFTVTQANQIVMTVTNYVLVNEVTYGDGGRWGTWSDGGGSSLELVDLRSDNRQPSNWADSDETAKSQWTSFEVTAPTDNGQGPNGGSLNDNLQVFLLGVGECLIDDIEVRNATNANVITNGGFEAGAGSGGWFFQGSHDFSSIVSGGFSGARSLRLRAASRGDNGANKVRSPNCSPIPAVNSMVTMRAKARWLRGHPEVLLRLHGGTIEVTGRMPLPFNLGTPGAPNSRAVGNAGPAIWEVGHNPILPAASEPVVVSAKAGDPDGVASLTLRYRIEPSATVHSLSLADNGTGGDAVVGDGVYSATLPGQASGTLIAFYLQAIDGAGRTNLFPQDVFPTGGLPRVFPIDSPTRECVIRWGERQMPGSFGTYHMWVTTGTSNRWSIQPPTAGARDNLDNANLDCTFVYNNYRVIYNTRTRFAGSPWHRGQMTTGPSGSNRTDYDVIFPDDDRLMGTTDFVVNTPGNPSGADASDLSCQSEQTSYIIFKEMGVHYNHRRYVHMFVNGIQRSISGSRPGNLIMEDCQQPNSDVIEEWFPDDTEGQFFKIEDWFEFNNEATAFNNDDADLTRRMTVINGQSVLDIAPYRFMWRPRSVAPGESASDYSQFNQLVDAASPPASPTASTIPNWQLLDSIANLDQWMRAFAVQHTVGNWDTYGYDRGKNAYAYKPVNGRFEIWSWDIDFTMGVGGHDSGTSVFGCNDPRVVAMWNTPEIRRMYLRAYFDIINGPLNNAFIDPIVTAKGQALRDNGVNFDAGTLNTITNFVRARRNYLMNSVATRSLTNFNYNVTTPASLSINSNLAVISGVAPLHIKEITATYDGRVIPVPFTAPAAGPTNWSLRVTVNAGDNEFVLKAYDLSGNEITSLRRTNTVTYTGQEVRPEDAIVINEIMYNPAVPNASYVEIQNTATNFIFDISGWRFDGLDYTFPPNTLLSSRAFLVLTKSRAAFTAAYGSSVSIFGEFSGRIDPDGETLALVKPGASPTEDVVVDKVRYEPNAPWASGASGRGAALQLIDNSVDNARASSWSDGSGWRFVSTTGTIQTNGTNILIWMASAGEVYIDDLVLVGGSVAGAGPNLLQNGDFESPLEPYWVVDSSIATNLTNSAISTDFARSGKSSLHVVSTGAGNQTRAIRQDIVPPATEGAIYTLSYWYRTSVNGTNLVVRSFPGSGLNTSVNIRPVGTTPNATNNVRASLPPYPRVWLNEVQPDNVNGPTDRFGNRGAWIELHNNDTAALSLQDFYLANDYNQPLQWQFPAGATIQPGQFLVIWADGQPGRTDAREWHTSFTLNPSSGSVALVRLLGPDPQVMDYLNYSGLAADQSYGDYPDGQPFDRRIFNTVTPGSTNIAPPVKIYINEWVASNVLGVNGYPDPADGNYDDWFELYNPNPQAVDLSGYYLTDNLANKTLWRIPSGVMIPSGGYLLVWADNDLNQNGGTNVDVHAGFRLERNGEAIGLFAVVGTNIVEIDAVTFGAQFSNISHGRFPDGAPSLQYMFTPTPRGPNLQGNTPPTLAPIADKTIPEMRVFSFPMEAADPDGPDQSLSFSLGPAAPAGARIDASGLFRWIPSETQGPGVYNITLTVTDNGTPSLSDSRTFRVTVTEQNRLPSFLDTRDKWIAAGQWLTFPTAADYDVPRQNLVFGLDASMAVGATIDPATGLFSWSLPETQPPGIYLATVQARDDGIPPLSASFTYSIHVLPASATVIVLKERRIGQQLRIGWEAVPGKAYRVEYRDAFINSLWVPLIDRIVATNDTLLITDELGDPQRFYRVLQLD